MNTISYSIIALVLVLLVIVVYGCILEKLKKKPGLNFWTAFLIVCVFLLIFGVLNAIYSLSSVIFEGFQEEPYKLEFKDCVNTVTQVVTFLVTTGLALVPFISSKYKDFKNELKKPTAKESKDK